MYLLHNKKRKCYFIKVKALLVKENIFPTVGNWTQYLIKSGQLFHKFPFNSMKYEPLLVLINETQSHISRVKAERAEKQSSQLSETSYLYEISDWIGQILSLQVIRLNGKLRSSFHLHYIPVSIFLVLGIKVWATTTWLCFSFRLIQPQVAQCGLELLFFLFLLPSDGIKGVCHTAWPLWLTVVGRSLVCFPVTQTPQIITLYY